MMSSAHFQKSVDSIFNRMAVSAEYQRLGRDQQTVQVILRQSDPRVELNDRPLLVNQYQLDVRVGEFAEPKRGDHFLVNDQLYRVEDEPQLDQHRLIWRMTVLPASDEPPPPVTTVSNSRPSATAIPSQSARLRMR